MQAHFHRASYFLAGAALLAGITATFTAGAADAPQAQATPMAAAISPIAPAPGQPASRDNIPHRADRVEDRISDLHTRLVITAAQEDSWGKVAGIMRDNANTMAALTQARSDKRAGMNAIDDLKSYAEIAEAHADGLQKFTPAFGSLYDSMSDQQKKNADSIFRARGDKSLKHKVSRHG